MLYLKNKTISTCSLQYLSMCEAKHNGFVKGGLDKIAEHKSLVTIILLLTKTVDTKHTRHHNVDMVTTLSMEI